MKNEQTKVTRRRYDADFKQKLLEMHSNGRSIRSLSEAFGINQQSVQKMNKYLEKSEQIKKSRKVELPHKTIRR